jgi:hypothetical protein
MYIDNLGLWVSLQISHNAWELISSGATLTGTGAVLAGAGISAAPMAGVWSVIPITVGIAQMGIGFYSFWEGASQVQVVVDYESISGFLEGLRPLEGMEASDLCKENE